VALRDSGQASLPHSQGDMHSYLVSILAKELRGVNRILCLGSEQGSLDKIGQESSLRRACISGAGVLVRLFWWRRRCRLRRSAWLRRCGIHGRGTGRTSDKRGCSLRCVRGARESGCRRLWGRRCSCTPWPGRSGRRRHRVFLATNSSSIWRRVFFWSVIGSSRIIRVPPAESNIARGKRLE